MDTAIYFENGVEIRYEFDGDASQPYLDGMVLGRSGAGYAPDLDNPYTGREAAEFTAGYFDGFALSQEPHHWGVAA